MGHSVAVDRPRGNAERPKIAAVVLAAGEGRRLAPLSLVRPKPLCPVGGRALLDLALDRVEALGADPAVNLHHRAEEVRTHLEASGRRVHLSLERPRALGTAGALGALRGWVDGRALVVVNADTWVPGGLAALLEGWDGDRVRVMVHGGARFGPRVGVVASVVPWPEVAGLEAEPSGLYEVLWRPRHAEGRLEVVGHDGAVVDCGTPVDYLTANLAAASFAGGRVIGAGATVAPGALDGAAVVGESAVVEGRVRDSVVWAGCTVGPEEVLDRSVRASAEITVGPLPVGPGPPG
jgi:mannose-1-phosphate guanylyltransferase/MurNAc alpha-1-phosphate uridylyltransferase